MANEKELALQCVLFSLEEMKEKMKYTPKPETIKIYCECIEQLAKVFKFLEGAEDDK